MLITTMRQDTAAGWTSKNPVLIKDEGGYETDTGKYKIGDGKTAWNTLAYYVSGAGSTATLIVPEHSHGYLPATAKAVDSELLDGLDSRHFLRFGAGSGPGINTKQITNLNDRLLSGWYDGYSMAGAPDGHWYLVEVISHSNNTNWQRQIAYSMTTNGPLGGSASAYTRRCNGGDATVATNWSAWESFGGTDTGWIEFPAWLNGTTAYQAGLGNAWTPRYRKRNGVVQLAGLFNTGATTTPLHVNTLPAGFRPGTGVTMLAIPHTGTGVRRMDVGTDGSMTLREQFAGAATTGWHSLQNSFIQEN